MDTLRPRMKTAAHTVKQTAEAMIASDMMGGEVAEMGRQWLACSEAMFAHARTIGAAVRAAVDEDAPRCVDSVHEAQPDSVTPPQFVSGGSKYGRQVQKDTRGSEEVCDFYYDNVCNLGMWGGPCNYRIGRQRWCFGYKDS